MGGEVQESESSPDTVTYAETFGLTAVNTSLNFSAHFGKLAEALAKATLEFKPVIKGTKNPFYKSQYADLATLIEATREPLARQGLVVTQFLGESVNNRVAVITALLHSSGEWLRSEIVMPCAKMDAQGIGSASTYARRYSYGALLNLAGEVDDDAEGAVSRNEVSTELQAKMSSQERVSQFQVSGIKEWLKRTGKTEKDEVDYLAKLGLVQWEELTKGQFNEAIKWAGTAKPKPKQPTEALRESVDMKRIFATANERGVPESDVKRYAYERHKVDSMTKLTKPQLQEVLEFVQGA